MVTLTLGAALVEGRSQVTPACVDGDCDEPFGGRSILQVKSPARVAAQPVADVLEEDGANHSQLKLHQAAQKMQGAGGVGGKKTILKGKVLLQTDTSALSRGGPVEEDTREDFRKVPRHIPVRVPDSVTHEEATSNAKMGGAIPQLEEVGLEDNHQRAGKKGRKPVKANSLVQMSNARSKAQLRDEEGRRNSLPATSTSVQRRRNLSCERLRRQRHAAPLFTVMA